MSTILNKVIQFFEVAKWSFTLEEPSTLRMGFRGNQNTWTCYVRVFEEQGQFIFYSICPMRAPSEKRILAAELLTRINFGLVIGNFEMDFTDGEIRFKAGIDVLEDHFNDVLMTRLLDANLSSMERYLPCILAVINTHVSPAEAVAHVEGQSVFEDEES